MIVTSPEAFREAIEARDYPADRSATMRAAFLVTPAGFRIERESASDNRYMDLDSAVDAQKALVQHQALAEAIMNCGVPVFSMPGQPQLPDGVFPNNCFGTVPGRFIVGSMRHQVRRGEANRADVRRLFTELFGYELRDLSRSGCVAELTGPLVIDRARGIGFCGMSERVDEAGCRAMHEAFDLDLTFRFDLAPGEYHTNVFMAVLAGRGLVLHPGSFADPAVPEAIASLYGDRVLRLSDEEKAAFAGNCIAVTERDVFFSVRAADAMRPESRQAIESWGFTIHSVALDELEKAGGSLRCMVAEVF